MLGGGFLKGIKKGGGFSNKQNFSKKGNKFFLGKQRYYFYSHVFSPPNGVAGAEFVGVFNPPRQKTQGWASN